MSHNIFFKKSLCLRSCNEILKINLQTQQGMYALERQGIKPGGVLRMRVIKGAAEVDCIDKVAWYPFFCRMREKRRLPANCCGGKSCLEERKAEGEGSSLPT